MFVLRICVGMYASVYVSLELSVTNDHFFLVILILSQKIALLSSS